MASLHQASLSQKASRDRILQSLGTKMTVVTSAKVTMNITSEDNKISTKADEVASDHDHGDSAVKIATNNNVDSSSAISCADDQRGNYGRGNKGDRGCTLGFVSYMEGILNNNELNNKNRRHTFVLGESLKAKAIILENITSQMNAGSTVTREKR